MSLFFTLLIKLTPLYLNILLGYLAGKLLDANRDTIARIMFFMINPLIMFNGVINTKIDVSILSVPVVTFLISSGLCILFYRLSRNIWDDSSKNVVGFSAGSGNTGYFGLALAILLFDDNTEGIYIMALLGITLYENSLGYYISAKGILSAMECLLKLFKLPSLYAFAVGLIINLAHISMPDVFGDFMVQIKGAYTVFGMMIIGLGLAGLSNFKLDMKFIGMTFLAKFLAWPLIVLTIIALDFTFFGIYNPAVYRALLLISIVPLAVNTVILASLMKTQPEKAASAVLLSTIFAIPYVPLMSMFFITGELNLAWNPQFIKKITEIEIAEETVNRNYQDKQD
jgi:predicted permease